MDDLQLQAYGFDAEVDTEQDQSEIDEQGDPSKEKFWRDYLERQFMQLSDRISAFNASLAARSAEIEDVANRFIARFDETLKISLNYDVAIRFQAT